MDSKTCTKCGERKSLELFYREPRHKDGRQSRCKVCHNASTKAWKAANPENGREMRLRKAHGITIQQYDDLLASQNGRCACCGTDTPGGSSGWFHVDHDHESGGIRGLLCGACNMAIGLLGDNIEGVARAMSYLTLVQSRSTVCVTAKNPRRKDKCQ